MANAMCSAKHSMGTFAASDLLRSKSLRSPLPRAAALGSVSSSSRNSSLSLSSIKPLYSTPLESFGLGSQYGPASAARLRGPSSTARSAYEADRSESIPVPAQKVKIGLYFATWWALNVVFNIYNKKVLNAFPYPWLTSTLSLAAGSLIMLLSWGARLAEAPKTDLDFWKSLAPVAVAHTIGHVAATVSMSKVAVSFTHIIKSGEPAFSVLVSRFLLGESFPAPVYLSLVPIIGGCALAAVTELNFNMTGTVER